MLRSPLFQIRAWLVFFIVGLVLSGLTAFPLLWELNLLCSWLGLGNAASPVGHSGLAYWLLAVREGLQETYARYPFMAYGTDWLAFAHWVIAVFFIGPLIDPVRNRWVLQAGMIACVMVVPLALICGPIRGIPPGWRLIDCSFGIFGILPLWWVHKLARKLESATSLRG
jgi:hypothetical protein